MNATDTALAAFFAKGGKVTKCPAAKADATPLRIMRQQAEAAMTSGQGGPLNILARDASGRIDPSAEARLFMRVEQGAERQMERAAAMRSQGRTVIGFEADGTPIADGDTWLKGPVTIF